MAKKKVVVKRDKLAKAEMPVAQDYRIAKGINSGTTLNICCNLGVRNLKVFAVLRTGSRMNRLPKGNVGQYCIGSVKKGSAKYLGTLQYVLIVRQRKTFKRKNGESIMFEDNAGVIVTNKGEMKATHINGPIAKEALTKNVAGKSLGVF
ncbi:MAG: hypothetical protein MHMPM18_002992 [Marteilia pararefringens]